MHRRRIQDGHAQRVGIVGADADRHAGRRVHDPRLDRLVQERAVVDPVRVVVDPCVGMRIELDQCHGPPPRRDRAQDRQRDEMIAPQGDRRRTRIQDRADMRLDPGGHLADIGVIERHVAVIDHVQHRHRIIAPAIGRIEGLQAGRLADRARSEACAGPVSHRLVEGDARHRDVDAAQVLGIAAAQKAGGPAKGVLEGQPAQAVAREGLIHLGLRIFQRHRRSPCRAGGQIGRAHGRAQGAPDAAGGENPCIRAVRCYDTPSFRLSLTVTAQPLVTGAEGTARR